MRDVRTCSQIVTPAKTSTLNPVAVAVGCFTWGNKPRRASCKVSSSRVVAPLVVVAYLRFLFLFWRKLCAVPSTNGSGWFRRCHLPLTGERLVRSGDEHGNGSRSDSVHSRSVKRLGKRMCRSSAFLAHVCGENAGALFSPAFS